MSPAQTIRDWPEEISSPCPKSTWLGQLAGRGGGDHERRRMSQRAEPPISWQPRLPLGERKVARWTGGAVAIGAPAGVRAGPLDWLGTDVAVLDVVVVSIVTVREDPHPPKRPSPQASVAARLTGFTASAYRPLRPVTESLLSTADAG